MRVHLHDHPGPGATDAYAWAELVGTRRFERGQRRNRTLRGRGRSLEDDICGMAAEAAACIYFGAPLADISMAAERARGYDVAGYQVRATSHPGGGLRINQDEHHGRFLLAITASTQSDGTVELAGWISGEEGRAKGEWKSTGGAEPWLRVDRAHLTPLGADEPVKPVGQPSMDERVAEYLADCAAAPWLERKYHPTAAGALKLIYHRGPDEAAAIKAAFEAQS
jgi:hypothetical protein